MTLATIERVQPRIGAFFDMDKTILSENSATLYMRYARDGNRKVFEEPHHERRTALVSLVIAPMTQS